MNIIIKGVTKEGNKFRPSDWAERLYYALASYDANRRLTFNPLVHLKQGEKFKCFVINPSLEEKDPLTFDFLIDFANSNNLVITEERAQTENVYTSESRTNALKESPLLQASY